MNPASNWALLLSWGAGIKLYLTLLLAGLAARAGWLPLPPGLSFLQTPWGLAIAGALLMVEFVVDKIPGADSFWDSIHTFIRVPAGILLAFGATVATGWGSAFLAALAGGVISLGSHGAKATVRRALNSTPEPSTNWFVSLSEEGLVVLAYWLLLQHPRLLPVMILTASALGWLAIHFLAGIFEGVSRLWRPPDLRRDPWRIAGGRAAGSAHSSNQSN